MPDRGASREKDQLSLPNVNLHQFPLSLTHMKFQLKSPSGSRLSLEEGGGVTVCVTPSNSPEVLTKSDK